MSTIKVKWTASSDLVRKEYIETGNKPKAEHVLELDMTALTPEQRKPIIEYFEHSYELDLSVELQASTGKFALEHYGGLDTSGTG